jgi:hypothetical protein
MPTPTAVTIVVKSGEDCYAYTNSGTNGTPTWTTQGAIKDVTLGDEVGESEQSIRRNRPFVTSIPAQRKLRPKFKIPWIPTDDLIIALLAAYQNQTAIDMVFLDGVIATPGSQGPRADWMVKTFPRTENLAEGQEIEIELCPALTANVPVWHVAA